MHKKPEIIAIILLALFFILCFGTYRLISGKGLWSSKKVTKNSSYNISNPPANTTSSRAQKKNFKMLLTSSGLTNKTLRNDFFDLVGKKPENISVAYVITASIPEDDIIIIRQGEEELKNMGMGSVEEIDIRDTEDSWLSKMEKADVIWIAGGNTYYLLDFAKKSGFSQEISKILDNKLYVGVSAGSILAGPDISNAGWDVGTKDENSTELTDFTGLSLVDFSVFPHYDKSEKNDLKKYHSKVNYPLYAIDNDDAIEVIDGSIKVVGEGKALLLDQNQEKNVDL